MAFNTYKEYLFDENHKPTGTTRIVSLNHGQIVYIYPVTISFPDLDCPFNDEEITKEAYCFKLTTGETKIIDTKKETLSLYGLGYFDK